MADRLQKLRPDRDLQCYFERPSAIAAISDASESGFRVSGTWRQQMDWAVVEWNRDNTFEHPYFRYLPDGDLSGLRLQYDERRVNCIALDSDLYATVDWPHLRLWVEDDTGETVYKVPLRQYATAVEGEYANASAVFTLGGTPEANAYIEVAWLDDHRTYQLTSYDTLESAVGALAATFAGTPFTAVALGPSLLLTCVEPGANRNRLGAYANVAQSSTLSWTPEAVQFSGGESPVKWHFDLPFSNLLDENGVAVPTSRVRKMRWTYAAELQAGAFERSEFEVDISNWSVSGANREYRVAGRRSRRIEDDDASAVYGGGWTRELGNYSGGSIRKTTSANASLSVAYRCEFGHRLYLGTRRFADAGVCRVVVDGAVRYARDLALPGEDVLLRLDLGEVAAGEHAVTFQMIGEGTMYFDFLEVAVPEFDLPVVAEENRVTLATDWDTDHSLALPAERTAWIQRSLGFTGPANHYVGALIFYEMEKANHAYASATVTFEGTPEFSTVTQLSIGPVGAQTTVSHLNLIGDSAASIAKAFEQILNNGFTLVRAEAQGPTLTVFARQMGAVGNAIAIDVSPKSGTFRGVLSGPHLAGGNDGYWRTDLNASPRINRACRDWSRSYYKALASYGIGVTAAFSTELQHGDPSVAVGIAQRYPNGEPAIVATPALQTNFGPESIAYWREVYRDMAQIMTEAAVAVSLQFGEIQWWYFAYPGIGYADTGGMPFYDAYTTGEFLRRHGRPLPVFQTPYDDPSAFGEETRFLAGLIGEYTDAIVGFVRLQYPAAEFEVLYPTDVNEPAFNKEANYPRAHWTPAKLDRLKTENFGFTFARNLDKARGSVLFPMSVGFARERSSHLVGVGDYTAPWLKELSYCKAEGLKVGVVWAMDQMCLIGYPLPLESLDRDARFMG